MAHLAPQRVLRTPTLYRGRWRWKLLTIDYDQLERSVLIVILAEQFIFTSYTLLRSIEGGNISVGLLYLYILALSYFPGHHRICLGLNIYFN